MPAADPPPGFTWSTMVPELLVSDLDASLRFWCGLCGFAVAYDRPEDRFAYLDRAGRQIMLEEIMAPGRRWVQRRWNGRSGGGSISRSPWTRAPILTSLDDAGWPLFLKPEEVWYRAGASETSVRQFLVQDPDGYLVRFSQGLGLRPAMKPGFS